jgi:tape measure domain-containing protein
MAELKLDVTLNLAGFRAQLDKLATEASTRLFGVKLLIDTVDFEKQLTKLEKIKPVITINDSQLDAARRRIGTLNKSLTTLRKATSTPIEIKVKYVEQGKAPTGAISKSGTFRQRLTGLDAEPIKQLYAAAGIAGLVQFDSEIAKNKGKIITALNQAGEDSVTGLLNGLKSKDSAVRAAAKSLGDILIATLKLSLQSQSPSKKMEAIGEDAGEGFNNGLRESLNEAKISAVSAMRGLVTALMLEAAKIQKISLAPGSLRGGPALAASRGGSRGGRGYFNPIGPLPEGSKEPYTMTDRGYQPYLGGPGVGPSAAPRGLLPPASAIGRGFSGQSFAGAPVNFRMGADLPALPSSEAAKRLRQQEQVAQGTAERLRQQARVAQAHLRSAERSATVFGERAARLDKAMSAFRTSGRATGYTSPIGPLPRDSAEPYAAGSRGMFGKQGFEPRLESRPVAGLLPPSLTPTREQIVAARTQVARERSNARALQVQLDDQFKQMQFNPTVPRRRDYFQPGMQPLFPGGGAPPRSGGIPPGVGAAVGGSNVPVGGGVPPRGGGMPPSGGGMPAGGGNVPPRSGNVPPSGGGGGPRGGGPFGGMRFTMPQLPGAGIVRELGDEFGFAAKQVLLFGAAYKALAFITDFPSQVGSAVGQLQSFRNTLKSITPSTAEFGQSSKFILSLVDQYNIPLQSARDGFTKLYASMQPAGFSGKEIRDLFEGISMGAATFGMSADKVDRVMYAFAQMASKGQVMSEELKGQLGDVLPGSLALFAKAAKMSVAQFSQAMEDGAFKGNAMRELIIKVGSTMRDEFGKGAVGAASTFQGVMNRLQTSTTLFYEAFEPAAVAFSNTFVLPLTNGLRVVTDAFTQLMTGQKAVTVSGSDLAAQMQPFIPIFQGIAKNLAQVGQAALGVAKSLMPIIQLILQLLASPIVGWLAQAYASVILLQGAFTLLGGRAILGAIAGLAQYSIGAARAAIVSQTMASQALSARMQLSLLASGAATTGVAVSAFAVAVRTAFITTAAGAVVIAVGMMISEFMRLRGVMDDIEGRYKGVADQARMMADSGNVRGIEKLTNETIQQANTYEKIAKKLEEAKKSTSGGGAFFEIDKDTADLLKRVGQGSLVSGENKNIITAPDIATFEKLLNLNRENFKENQKIIDQQKTKAKLKEKEFKAGGAGTGTKDSEDDKKKINLEAYESLKDQLSKASTQADIDRINTIFEHRKFLINSVYDLEEARANSIQKEAIAHQKTIANIFLDLQKKQIDARLDVLKVQGSVAGGAPGAVAFANPPGGIRSTNPAVGSNFQGYRVSSAPGESRAYRNGTHEGFDFETPIGTALSYAIGGVVKSIDKVGKGNAGKTIEVMLNNGITGMSMHLSEVLLAAGQSFEANQIIAKTGDTGAGPAHLHQESAARGYLGGQAGASLSYLNIGSGQAAPTNTTVSAGDPRKVSGDVKRDVLATQGVEIAQQKASLVLTHSQTEAQIALNIAKETYLAQIFGIAEKELQLGESQKQIALLKAGFTDNEIEDEMKLETIRLKHAAAIDQASKAIISNNALKGVSQQELNDMNAYQNKLIDELNKKLPQSIKLQQNLNKAGKDYTFTGRIKALEKEIQLLATVGDAERRLLELRQGGLTPKEAQQVYSLEKVKKNLEDTKALIGNFVSSTSNDYKGFLKAVISGEDAVDALQKFQEGLTDKVLTIFLDFAMAPVEEVMKKSLGGLFAPKVNTTEVPVVANTTELTKNTAATIANTNAITGKIQVQPSDPTKSLPSIPDFSKNAFNISSESAFAGFNTEDMFGGLNEQIRAGLAEIPSSFAEATANLQVSSEPFKQALIAELPNTIATAGEGVQTQGATFGEGLTSFVGGIGAAAAGIAGIAAGISQIGKGGTSNVLGGIGSVLMGAGGAIGGFGKIFGFADGGMVSGPTLGMVGEGKYNEAIVPLPNGRSIPVQFNQESSLRSAMGSDNSNNSVSPVLSMSFETTRFGNTDYVSRDQLEAAMMQTRAEATKAGARRGMTMTLDKLQQSPSTRSRVGLG